MDSKKIMLLGIAMILLGICSTLQFVDDVYIFKAITEFTGAFFHYIGFIIVVVGFFMKDKQ